MSRSSSAYPLEPLCRNSAPHPNLLLVENAQQRLGRQDQLHLSSADVVVLPNLSNPTTGWNNMQVWPKVAFGTHGGLAVIVLVLRNQIPGPQPPNSTPRTLKEDWAQFALYLCVHFPTASTRRQYAS